MTGPITFRTTIELGGKTATGLPVPEEVVHALGPGRRPGVIVTIGGHTYRSTIASMGGRWLIPLSAENRAAAGVAAGDHVDVHIEADTATREVAVPHDLATALEHDHVARDFFDSLPTATGRNGLAGSTTRRNRKREPTDFRSPSTHFANTSASGNAPASDPISRRSISSGPAKGTIY